MSSSTGFSLHLVPSLISIKMNYTEFKRVIVDNKVCKDSVLFFCLLLSLHTEEQLVINLTSYETFVSTGMPYNRALPTVTPKPHTNSEQE